MSKKLTVDQLIQELQAYSEQGYGEARIVLAPSGANVTSACGPVAYTNAEGHAVILYAKTSEVGD